MKTIGSVALLMMLCAGCEIVATAGEQGAQGPAGAKGAPGPAGPPGEFEYKSGERLRRLIRVTADGGRHFETWHDEEIGGSCTFLIAADSDERCLPYDSRAVPIELLYTNDSCTLPVAFIAADVYGSLPPAFTYKLPGSFGMRVRHISINIGRPTNVYKTVLFEGNVLCNETVLGDGLFYNVEPELPPDAFVSGTVEID